jgi:dephospho-CoA kinase
VIAPGGPGYDAVIAAFGREIVAADGTIDRRKLGEIVFSDPARLQALNALSHPIMADMMAAEIKKVREGDSPPPLIILDAALLFEAHWDKLCDRVWVVTAARETAVARLMARNDLSREQAQARLDSQMDPAEKEARAEHVIANDGDLDALYGLVDRLWDGVTG